MIPSEALSPLEEAIRQGTVGGAALAVGRGEEILLEWAGGRAFIDPPAEMRPDTLFDAGTMTQPLATASIFIALPSEHRLNLNACAVRFWPEFGEEGKEKVSLRHLLKHTSGLPAERPYFRELMEQHPDWVGTARGKEFILGKLASEALEYPPTYALVQSSLGYLALGAIAERIGGASFDVLFSRIVAEPLHLPSARFILPPEMLPRAAATGPCPVRGRMLRGEPLDPNAWAMGGVAGHAGLFLTAAEAVKIGLALAASLERDGGWLPSPGVGEFIGPRTKYKMGGWDVPGRENSSCGSRFSENTVGHTTGTGHSLWIDLEKKIAVAVLAASSPAAPHPIAALLPGLHDAIHDQIA